VHIKWYVVRLYCDLCIDFIKMLSFISSGFCFFFFQKVAEVCMLHNHTWFIAFLFLILEYEIPDRIRNPDKIPDNDVITQTCAAKQRYTALRISPAELSAAILTALISIPAPPYHYSPNPNPSYSSNHNPSSSSSYSCSPSYSTSRNPNPSPTLALTLVLALAVALSTQRPRYWPMRRGSTYLHPHPPRTQNTWGADPPMEAAYTTHLSPGARSDITPLRVISNIVIYPQIQYCASTKSAMRSALT
jgi:hypothetical protein